MWIRFRSALIATICVFVHLPPSNVYANEIELAPVSPENFKSCTSGLGDVIPDSHRACLVCEASGIGAAKYANYACLNGKLREMPPCAAPSNGKACRLPSSDFCRAYGGPTPHIDVGEEACVYTGAGVNGEELFERRYCRGVRDQHTIGGPIVKGQPSDVVCKRFIYPNSFP